MCGYPVSRCVLVFVFFSLLKESHLTFHENSHGFLSQDKYLVEDISYHEGFSAGAISPVINDLNLKYLLKFDPEQLDFQQRPLGVPHIEKVTLHNVHDNRSIDMTSISGSTVHFHSSFFEDKKIPPLGNTTFNVVFLGREEGAIQSDLFIHTTEGRFKYQVKGASVHSPYRLRPIVNVMLPINATFSPFIYMYNPRAEPIQIVEMYSSGGDFHLELPSGEMEGPKDMWEILPYETKAIIRVRFHARSEQNHTAYVRIKLKNSEEVLVVPLEVEVTSSASLFTPRGFVDFGIGGSMDGAKTVPLYVQNPLKKLLRVQSVTSTSPVVTVDLQETRVPADKGKGDQIVKIANLTVDWLKAFETKDYSGKIVIKYKNNRTCTEIPFYVTLQEGGLTYETNGIQYFIDEIPEKVKPKNVLLKNKYSVPVLLLNVTLEPNLQSHFSVTNFQPTTLEPSEEAEVFSLKLKSGKTLPQSKVTSSLTVRTNVSEITIPVCCYNGKVDLVLPFVNGASSLNLGLISSNTAKTVHFLISNKNPIDIHMKRVKTSIPSAIVDLIGCFSGNPIETLMQETHKNLTKCSILEADNFAIFRLTIETFSAEGQIWGDVTLETQYEQLSIPVHFKIAHGKLEIGPDRLVFDQCFPAKICSHPIRVHSTFPEPMTVEEVVPLPPDPRITYRHVGRIQPKTTKVIGHLYLDPTVECKNECYAGLQHDTTAQWLRTLMLSEGASEFDVNLINLFYNRYMNQTANGTRKWQNLTMKLETSEVKAHIFRTRVKMSWPSLLADQNMLENRSVYTMPLVQVENVSLQNITIRNPSNYNLVVQVVLERYYPELENLYEGLPSTFVPQKLPRFRRPSNRFFFAGDYQKLQENFRNSFDLPFDKKSVPLLIKPGQNATVTIGYKVEDTLPMTGLVFLRNNLTIIELLILKGRGAQQNFKFGNRRPGSMQPLAFELLDKHLRECERGNQGTKFVPPTITVKRTFTARNMGDLPVDVYGFYINGLPCEGYGFKVLNCEPFVLPPNGTRKIDIACTPDFTLAKITRDLVLDTSLNFPVNYTLVTTVPAYYLPLCTNAIARPTWEGYFYFVAVFLMSSLLAFAMLTPIIDSERIVKHTLGLLVSRNCVNAEPTLDLRLIGQQTRCEIRQKIEVDCGAEKKVEKEVISKEIKEVLKEVAKETAKAKSLDLIEDLKVVKEEPTEKSSVLIPVPPRQKKKLSKKSSNELPPETTSTKKPESPNNNNNINLLQEKPQKQPTKTDPIPDEVRKMEAKELKKLILPKVKLLKAEECPVGLHEEETSSTTTESSSNNEEEKGVRGAVAKQQPVKVAACEETPVKVEKRKVGPLKVRKEKEGYEKNENHRERFHSDGRRRNKYVRERKEKHSSNKLQKKVFDFSCLMNHKEKANTTPTTNVWSEKRATFSDVVSSSRNDTIPIYQPTTTTTPKITSPILLTPSPPLVSTIPPQQQQPQRTPSPPPPPPPKPLTPVLSTPPQPPPILFRQPHHFKPSDSLITNHTDHCEQRAELGPIGSRKHDGFHLQDAPLVPAVINGSNPVQEEACQTLRMSSSSNSLFSDGKRSLLSEMPNPFLDFWNGDEWEQKCCAGGGLLQGKANGANATGNLQGGGTWTYNTNPNGLRDNLYTPPSEVTSPPAERTSSQAGYLWGSSSVWQPWAPEKPKTPTRMPPGFTHREIEMQIQQRVQHQQQQQQQQQQQNDLYNPFSSSNIWTSHPWEYNPEQ